MEIAPDSKVGWRLLLAPSIFGAFLLFLALWRLDFPAPSYDDLFMAGAALNLATGGDFSNPLLIRQEFPSHYYFVQPPLNSYALAGWLKLFSVNAGSVTAFPMLWCFVIAASTIVILRRNRAPVWLEWSVPLGVTFGIMYLGLRTEPPSVALAMAGFALTDGDATRRRAGFQFTGLLLLMLGASASPRIAPFIAALGLCAAHRSWQAATNPRERWRVAAWCFMAALITSLAFLAMIGFRLGEFLHTFQYHASGRLYKSLPVAIKAYLFEYLGYLQLPIILLPLALLAWSLKKPKDDLNRPAYFIAAAIPLVLWSRGVGSGTAWWAFLMLVLLAGSLMRHIPRRQGTALLFVIFLVLVEINRKDIARCWGRISGNIKPDRGGELAAALSLQSTADHPLLIDGAVARYVYNYRLPERAVDAEWCVRFPGASPGSYRVPGDSSPQLRKGDIFVVGNYMRGCLDAYTYLESSPSPKWLLFGLPQLGFEKYPAWVYIIPSEDCKEVRTNASLTLPSNQ